MTLAVSLPGGPAAVNLLMVPAPGGPLTLCICILQISRRVVGACFSRLCSIKHYFCMVAELVSSDTRVMTWKKHVVMLCGMMWFVLSEYHDTLTCCLIKHYFCMVAELVSSDTRVMTWKKHVVMLCGMMWFVLSEYHDTLTSWSNPPPKRVLVLSFNSVRERPGT